MITVSGVTKTFDGFTALDAVDLNAPRGAVYGLVGSNGAGKTTILRHLAGVYRQDSGTVEIDGQSVFENTAVKARVGFIPDDLYFYPASNLLDMARFLGGIYPRFDWVRFAALAEAFPIEPRRPMRRLSRGMQKQAFFRLMLACRFDVLLLDEPVDGLDPVMRRTLWKILLDDVAQEGLTVMVSSHNLRELEDVCDHVGIMHRGRVVLERALSALQGGTHKLQAAFEAPLPETIPGLSVLHRAQSGKVYTLIVRGDGERAAACLSGFSPLFVEVLPLSLEEIFIYEMGGENYGGIL